MILGVCLGQTYFSVGFFILMLKIEGKPGGGAPKIDNNGQLKTKISGTLKWNLSNDFLIFKSSNLI